MSLSATDVSVVIAGPSGPLLHDSVASVREHLPGAQVIVSTWRGTVGRLDADIVVQNLDPGSTGHNTNRMIRSASAGVRRATRPYTLKIRSDSVLDGTGFLDWWEVDLPRGLEFRVFEQRLLTVQVATRPSKRMSSYLFHPSDCVHFGRTADVRRMWGVREIDETANVSIPSVLIEAGHRGPRLWNEQSLWLSVLRRAGFPVDYEFWGTRAAGLAETSERSIINNFVVLEDWQFGVRFPKLASMVAASGLSTYTWLSDWRDSVAESMEVAL